jgi:hypothetical protein
MVRAFPDGERRFESEALRLIKPVVVIFKRGTLSAFVASRPESPDEVRLPLQVNVDKQLGFHYRALRKER